MLEFRSFIFEFAMLQMVMFQNSKSRISTCRIAEFRESDVHFLEVRCSNCQSLSITISDCSGLRLPEIGLSKFEVSNTTLCDFTNSGDSKFDVSISRFTELDFPNFQNYSHYKITNFKITIPTF